uniref:Conotoxin Mo1274 n=2 Tax=Conus monile TaxID=351660 RepID=CT274_CONMO|nr:RecName: Full=Conotoxin Mo1274 [Conus monile]
GNWCCSARVCC